MTHTANRISIYAADTSGVCSALYELGGLSVIHDASGCNSTYTTFDEPRWYDSESMVCISALTETDAIMGNDEKLVSDITEAAREHSPRFIALCGSPVAMMIGTDFPAIALEVEQRTGIPSFSVSTNGMHSYLEGASRAWVALIDRFCKADAIRTPTPSVNILGATPLDFSLNGTIQAIGQWLSDNGFSVISTLAMGSTLEQISHAGSAWVNLVISYSGLAVAQELKRRFGTPYVVGVPYGTTFAETLGIALHQAAEQRTTLYPCVQRRATTQEQPLVVVGESVASGSLASAIWQQTGQPVRVLCPLETADALLAPNDVLITDESTMEAQFLLAGGIIADPLYLPLRPKDVPLYRLPHVAFSGRCFPKEIPNLINKPIHLEETIW